MSKKISCTALLLYFITLNSFSQLKELQLKNISSANGKSTRIFVTALWCTPCMHKYKTINKLFKEDTSYNNIIVFDASGFKMDKLAKIIPDYYDTLSTFFIPYKYYNAKGFIVFKLPEKALKKMVIDFKTAYPKNDGLKDFWYGDMITIDPEGNMKKESIAIE